MSLSKRCLAELFGTSCLVFAGTGAIIVDQITRGQLGVVGIGLVFGFIVMAMIGAVGPLSGAHLNPAVTIGFAVAGRHPHREIVPYLGAQLAGAALGSALLRLIFYGDASTLGATIPRGAWPPAFALEFAMTFLLMAVILLVAVEDREEGIPASIAIGATVALEAIFGGPISGASMNPARSFGPALIGHHFAFHWLYWLAPIGGSLLATVFVRFLTPSRR